MGGLDSSKYIKKTIKNHIIINIPSELGTQENVEI